jgi:hypothetical protein
VTEVALSAASVFIAAVAIAVTATLLVRQNKQLEHERNALTILDAISQLAARFEDSQDMVAPYTVASYFETVACLARRRVLDPSLLVDAAGYMLRKRWDTIREFIERLRRVWKSEYIFNNFEWLAMYSVWWKDVPRPPNDPNYDPNQFGGLTFKV